METFISRFKIIVLLWFIFQAGSGYCQNVQSYKIITGLKDSAIIRSYYDRALYSNGKIRHEGNAIIKGYSAEYEIKIPVGEWKYYYKNGQIKRYTWSDSIGNPIKTECNYYKNGNKKSEKFFDSLMQSAFMSRREKISIHNIRYYIKLYRKDGSIYGEGI